MKGVEEGMGLGRIVEWTGHYYLVYMCDYMTGVILQHVQPEEWESYTPFMYEVSKCILLLSITI